MVFGVSDRTLEFLDESLLTIDLFIEKYPLRNDLFPFCKRAKARYIIGEAVRQMTKNRRLASTLVTQACKIERSSKLYKFLFLITKLPVVCELVGKTLQLNKSYLKGWA
ncbi:MAG: hypothetical protein Q8T08_20895, partial [Ignavibacteria bacterium]|nr:hypothetical protein [Ignavibacteria bacterium]